MQVVDLDELKRSGMLWQGQHGLPAPGRVLPSGWAVLDELLGGGWPRAALVEVLSEAHQGLPLLLPLLVRLVEYAAALAGLGRTALRAVCTGAGGARGAGRAPAAGARGIGWTVAVGGRAGAQVGCLRVVVLVWPRQLQTAQLRRLQLAAEEGDCVAILFRSVRAARQASPAALRLRVCPVPSGLEVEVLKRRGGWGGDSCIVPVGIEPMPDAVPAAADPAASCIPCPGS
ncbi:MAG: hypothetical protein H6962_12515 [Chromatiaceae bacterium]|nr:hypothetical protein [Chromatiaceae bacterium]